MKIKVSWEEIQAGECLHLHEGGELWVRVLSTQSLNPSNALPEDVAAQVSPEVLGRYHKTSCDWHPDLREDDDETVIEWPYEQWWALPKMKVIA